MPGFSKALAVKIYEATLKGSGRSNLVAIPALYLSLHTAEPGDDSAPSSEAAYTGYSRYNLSTAFTLGSDETTGAEVSLVAQNSGVVEFGVSTTVGTTTISHWAIWDSASGGTAANLLFSGALLDSLGAPTTRGIQEGDIPIFQAGQFKLKLV